LRQGRQEDAKSTKKKDEMVLGHRWTRMSDLAGKTDSPRAILGGGVNPRDVVADSDGVAYFGEVAKNSVLVGRNISAGLVGFDFADGVAFAHEVAIIPIPPGECK
jgi:hypothetical protein